MENSSAKKEKRKMSRRKKIVIAVIASIVVAAIVGGGIFYCTFFPNPLAKKIPVSDISAGTMSVTGESNVLVAYFSLTNNRAYTADEMDAVSSASLKIEDGTGYGHAELLALAAQEVTGGDLFPIKVDDLYPETYGGAFDRHHSEMGTSIRPELTEHLESVEYYDTVIIIYPNWLSSMPVPVLSFLEEYDFSGKTIIPIATSQALGLGSGPEQIAAACPEAVVADGLSARSEDGVKEFLIKAGLAK